VKLKKNEAIATDPVSIKVAPKTIDTAKKLKKKTYCKTKKKIGLRAGSNTDPGYTRDKPPNH